MSSGGRRDKRGMPRDGQPKEKAATNRYRSLEGALGRALRLSRTTGRALAKVWQNAAGEYSIHPAGAPPGDGWSEVATVQASTVSAELVA